MTGTTRRQRDEFDHHERAARKPRRDDGDDLLDGVAHVFE